MRLSRVVRASALALVGRPWFGFERGHRLTPENLRQLEWAARNPDRSWVQGLERRFAKLAGCASAWSFAAGRMALYTLLKAIGVREGSEVVLTAFTCSVVPNAVLRLSAIPVFTDVDLDTWGSDPEAVTRAITPRTAAIVAQHSFGIPCRIDEIVAVARQRGIPVIEDCALSVGSLLDGRPVGSWGDAAFFSTSHNKPINLLIGGLAVTNDTELAKTLDALTAGLPELSDAHTAALFERLRFEANAFQPERYARTVVANSVRTVLRRASGASESTVFLEDDYAGGEIPQRYPYPARLPPFLARVGLMELEAWPEREIGLRQWLARYLGACGSLGIEELLPARYLDRRVDIVPLRLVLSHPDQASAIRALSGSVDTRGTWFLRPVIGHPAGGAAVGYVEGSCPRAEALTRRVVNLPTPIGTAHSLPLHELLARVAGCA